jgi:DNA segregation ATPase FtsK/SpoIIIE, S-DNA-T family
LSTKPLKRKDKIKSTAASKKLDEGIPLTNKLQILGFFIALIGVLITLSIISYSDIDQSRLDNFKIIDIFKTETKASSFNTANWLGVAGVIISSFLIKNSFGYFSLIIPGLIILYGIILIRKKKIFDSIQMSIYLLSFMILSSAFFGLLKFNIGKENISYTLSGNTGDYLSSILYHLIGSFAGYILLSLLIIFVGFLIINRDIFTSLAKLSGFLSGLKEKYNEASAERKLKKTTNQDENENYVPIKNKSKKKLQIEEEPQLKDTTINRPFEDSLIADTPKISKKEIKIEEPIIKPESKVEPKPVKQRVIHDKQNIDNSENITPIAVEELNDYKLPPLELLDEPLKEELEVISDDELNENGKLLQAKLLLFGVKIKSVFATPGPVVTLYELIPEEDVKLSKIESLQDDIALAMKAKGIRMIIPIPGKGTVGIEIPNHNPKMVKIKGVIGSKKFADSGNQLPIALGKTIAGEVYIDDLAKMPHLLIAGSTGSGKSVGINTIIASLLYKMHPSDLKFILIDPKKIELNLYSKLKNHYLAVSKDINESIVTTPQNSVNVLKSLELEMEKRYERLAHATVRNISDYNKKFSNKLLKDDEVVKHSKMPYLIVIIDELADLMITAAREVEEPIARLAQLARAVGIHLILATQRPSVDVITGVIKANFSARVAYLVNSKVDSRTILDMNGADQLLGLGDMLYLPPGVPKPIRIQNPFISAEEVEKITDFIGNQKGFTRPYELPSVNASKKKSLSGDYDRDELFEEAAKMIVRYQQGSVSVLQRRLKIGYARAARIVDELEMAGIVGPGDGSKQREVLVESESQLEDLFNNL